MKKIKGLSRRDFMKTMAVLTAAAGMPGLLQSCGNSGGDSGNKEIKTLFFDHSHLNYAGYDFFLSVGGNEIKLQRTTPELIRDAKKSNDFLRLVPDSHITHLLPNLALPADDVQLLYVKKVPTFPNSDSLWGTVSLFLHVPRASLDKALPTSDRTGRGALKAKYYGLVNDMNGAYGFDGEEELIAPTDTASAIVFSFPEIMSFDADSAAHVMHNIISQEPATEVLAQIIKAQGNSWSENVVLKDDQGNPLRDDDGAIIQMIQYSETTMQFAGVAIKDSLSAVKQDPLLYVNLSDVTDPSELKGKLCTLQDGRSYTDASTIPAETLNSDVRMTLTDVCTGGGYKLQYLSGKKDAGNTVTRFRAVNSYTRHLSMHVRYLNANNKPIAHSLIGNDFFAKYSPSSFVLSGPNYEFDTILRVVETNFVAFGVKVKDTEVDFDIPIPPIASKIQIIGCTIGWGDNHYKHIQTGTTLTAVFDLAIPGLFLLAGAASSYKLFAQQKNTAMIIEVIRLFISLHAIIIEALSSGNSSKLLGLAVEIGKTLLAAVGSKYLLPALLKAIGVSQIAKAIPIIGAVFSAISSLASAAQLAQTTAQILNSPWSYVKTLSLSHDINVEIRHDPKNPEGFPSVATCYLVTVTCQLLDGSKVVDSATPIQLKAQMPATTRTTPIIARIPDVPYGGSVSIAVGFYSPTGWLAGYATLDYGDNTKDYFVMTIVQNQVPLTSATYYSHKEKTSLDSQGRHIWVPSVLPPTPTPIGQCNQTQGQLCQILDIADSNTFASVGYAWKAYGQAYQACSGGAGQMYFFANISTTELPEDSYTLSCGQRSPVKITYDLMGNSRTQRNFYIDVDGGNVIRQIRLALRKKPEFDGPASNRAWGRLNFSSDAMLLHPNGKIVSINATLSKIEVLTLPQEPTTDDQASFAAVYGGQGIREGLLDGPLCAALTPKGEILILETANNRIQAFDTGGNPMKIFNNGRSYFAPLKYSAKEYQYLDMATEYTGYIYLLCYRLDVADYRFYLDIYAPDGTFVSRTSNFSGMKIVVSYWRDVFSANMEALKMTNQSLPAVTEPSISRWIPSTPRDQQREAP